MNQSPKVLAFAGSLRPASLNKRLLAAACKAVEKAGGQATLVDLADYALPLYDQTIEDASGVPAPARALKDLMEDHDALLLSCPEYNGGITPLLKNTLDWVSRKEGDEPPLRAFRGKTAALMAASPGAFGGLRGLAWVRILLNNLGVLVIPTQLAVGRAHEAFGDDGALTDKSLCGRLDGLAERLVQVTAAVR